MASRFSEPSPAQTPVTLLLASPAPPTSFAPETNLRRSYIRPVILFASNYSFLFFYFLVSDQELVFSSYFLPRKAKGMSTIAKLDDETVHSMAVGAIFDDYVSLDFRSIRSVIRCCFLVDEIFRLIWMFMYLRESHDCHALYMIS